MPQGKLKAKAKVPASVAKKKAKAAKGPGISRKSKLTSVFFQCKNPFNGVRPL